MSTNEELVSQPLYASPFERRDFLRAVGGIAVLCLAPLEAEAQQRPRRGGGGGFGAEPDLPLSAWLHIGEDGAVTAYTGKVECGQNTRTGLTLVVAEELRLTPAQVQLVMGDTDRVPFDMGTFGSMSAPRMAPILRKAAATAREMLLGLAAAKWKVDQGQLTVAQGQVSHAASGRQATFAELAKGQHYSLALSDAGLTPPDRWQVAGHPAANAKGRAVVTGGHRYPSDITVPGLAYGKILRPPSYGARLKSLDSARAEAISGVTVVRQDEFVGVVGPTPAAAEEALLALKAEWQTASQISDAELFAHLRPKRLTVLADVAGPVRLEQTYTVAYIAHTPLEPRAAVAQWGEDGRLTVWAGTQRPFGVRQDLAREFKLAEDKIHVLMPDAGGGYGGKHTSEHAIEAARLAHAAKRPVKLIWTRTEEFTWAYFRPAGVIDVTAVAERDGALTAWEMHNYHSGPSGLETPYTVPRAKAEFHRVDGPLRTGSYRGLAATANFFARETAMDELAVAVGADPLAYRLRHLRDARLKAVFEAAANHFGWQPGLKGIGLGGGSEKGSHVATCVQVVLDGGKPRVLRAVTAFECGTLINPSGVRNQVEGGMMQALGGALFEAIGFADGKLRNASLSAYRVPRFSDLPKIEVLLLDRRDIATAGAGETPLMGMAPAIGNALFSLTGERRRSMPLWPTG
jgi:isoquinoline 1-oxidoreductase